MHYAQALAQDNVTTDRMCSLATSDENEVDGNVGIARRGDQLALSLAKRQGNGERERRELLETWMASAALAATTHTPKERN